MAINIEESEVIEGTAVNIFVLLLSDVLIERDFEITLIAKSNGTIKCEHMHVLLYHNACMSFIMQMEV